MNTRITHKQKEILEYYSDIADHFLPHLHHRPLIINGYQSFYEDPFAESRNDKFTEKIKTVSVLNHYQGEFNEYVFCDDLSTLLSFVHRGYVEFHSWSSHISTPDQPSYAIISIIPSATNSFDQVISLAQAAQEILARATAISYCKLSGPQHLQIFIPLHGKYSFHQAKEFAKIISTLVHEQLPSMSTLDPKESEKILIDYSLNEKEKTSVSVYSVMIGENVLVSAPLQWKEITSGLDPSLFTPSYVKERIRVYGELFDVDEHHNNLNKCLKSLGF